MQITRTLSLLVFCFIRVANGSVIELYNMCDQTNLSRNIWVCIVTDKDGTDLNKLIKKRTKKTTWPRSEWTIFYLFGIRSLGDSGEPISVINRAFGTYSIDTRAQAIVL